MLVIGAEPPRLTWRTVQETPGARQLGYEIQASVAPDFGTVMSATTEVATTEQVGIPAPGGRLKSREVRYYRVRVRADDGWSEWGDVLAVEAGLCDAADWLAHPITLPNDPGRSRPAPSPVLRREFDLDGDVRRARLHVTSLGLHEVRINGERVGDHRLAPGWTSYRKRLLADTHDVTALLGPGVNVVGAVLGDGWYRGRLGWKGGEDRCRYGGELGLILQLEAQLGDGRMVVVATDETWRATTGEVLAADIYDGAVVDLREHHGGWDRAGYDDSSWQPAAVVPFDLSVIEPRSASPVREVATWPVTPVRSTVHRLRLDSGQNLAGFVRLRVRGMSGQGVTVRHAEVLEPDGSLHAVALRSARATDEYVLADDGETVLDPPFTFHGFRYADVETEAEVLSAEVVAISSDLPPRGDFACSDPRLTRLHENVVWSQRSNFVSIPMDSPQRDERLGWTADAQTFVATACTLFDCEAFWQSWLRDLELDQDERLGVSSVVPDVVLTGEDRFGRAGWADAATIVPWAVYESYGDLEILRRQFPSMQRWVDSLVRRQGPDGLLPPSWQYGDWLDPDAPSDRPWQAKADSHFIANAFFAHSARLAADAAAVLGDDVAAGRYRAVGDRVAALTWEEWSAEARLTQTGCAIALRLRIAPARERTAVADALARLVDQADGRVATGYLGTPLVLPALADAGLFDQAYRMLLRTEAPSWLYQVERGATTLWERWDAIRHDGSIHPGTMAPMPGASNPGDVGGHMLSFNHVAHGAVADWMYRHVAGLAPDPSGPGYARVLFAPRPFAGCTWARGSLRSRFGTIKIGWSIEDARFLAEVELPSGTTGTFVPPATAESDVIADGVRVDAGSFVRLTAGEHQVVVTNPALAGIPTARPRSGRSAPSWRPRE